MWTEVTSGIAVAALALVALAAVIAVSLMRAPTPPVSSTPASTPTPTPLLQTPVLQTASLQAGAISGRFGYPSDFIPPLTVYAISTTDQRVWYSVDFAGFGNPPRPTLPPGVSQPTYTITGVAPGTYWVVAYRNDRQLPDPYYSRANECMRTTPSGPCPDGSLIPVTVISGQTTSGIDLTTTWGPPPGQPSPTIPSRPTPR